ncbi:MAG: CoA-binding protein [Bacteroidota bacterium]|jgi:predicted CoA-binding protein
MKQTTLVMGASPNAARYSYMATQLLRKYHYPVIAFGLKSGKIDDTEITPLLPETDIDTVTLYLGPQNQIPYVDYLLKLKPARVIFNPGTENPELQALLREQGIEVVEACTLVMLQTGQF